ncbi:hypothetical protein DWV00_16640 [Trinickia dinghuensis]|uniref:Uncharacterized protein n=1 Tax=Trinickia dinghuensis TaxID=2291023 RepID=A0A3D8JY13_9BURK|nr:hypothetical protein DWV00_16640 [Trinickia dinghuensis]
MRMTVKADDTTPAVDNRMTVFWPELPSECLTTESDQDLLLAHYPHLPAGVADGSVRTLHRLLDREGGPQFWFVSVDAVARPFSVASVT